MLFVEKTRLFAFRILDIILDLLQRVIDILLSFLGRALAISAERRVGRPKHVAVPGPEKLARRRAVLINCLLQD